MLVHRKKLGARQCWRCRKSRRTRWRIALLFRLGGICNCWLLSGPADGLVLLLADVLNRIHVDSKWGMVSQCPAFMGGLSPVLYQLLVPARHASKWSNLWRPPEISLISVKPQQSLFLLIGVLLKNQKDTNDHHHWPISVFILLTSKLEAILENYQK